MNIRNKYNIYFRYFLTAISPKLSIKFWFRYYFKRSLNLKNPSTLDEKIQWMKLNYYSENELVRQCADKYLVRDYIKKCGLGFILNEVYAIYDSVDEIDWSNLPEKFVLKWNFGCGGNIICYDKSKLDLVKASEDLRAFGKIKFHLLAYEPQYKVKEKKIICERFIESEAGALPEDYKFYCFNGVAKFVLCCMGRGEDSKPSFYFFDKDWTLLRYNRMGKEVSSDFTIPKPVGIDKLFEYAEILSKPFPFVRVDFYLEKGIPYFGEMTFTPSGGYDLGRLPESDKLFGSFVNLQENVK